MASMYLALGYQCNHHCFFCPCGLNTVKTPAAPTERLIEAVDRGIQEQGIDHITISGGEPTCHPGFNKIIRHCAAKGLRVGILSNGDNFSDIDRCRQLLEGVDRRYVSVTTAVHSDLPELFEKVTRVPGSYQRTVNGIGNLLRLGIPVTVKQVISAWNYRRLAAFTDFVYRTYGPAVSLTFCGMDFCGMKKESIREVAVRFKEIGPNLENALDLITDLRTRFNAFLEVTVADLPLCCVDPSYWGYFAMVSRIPVSQYSAPGIEKGSVDTTSDIPNECDIFAAGCRECAAAEVCPGMWRSVYEYYGGEAVCPLLPE